MGPISTCAQCNLYLSLYVCPCDLHFPVSTCCSWHDMLPAIQLAGVVVGQIVVGLLAGWNLVPEETGLVSVGDQVQVSKRRNGLDGLQKDD